MAIRMILYLADVPGSSWWVCNVVSPPPPWPGPPLCRYFSLNKFVSQTELIIRREKKVGIRVNNNINSNSFKKEKSKQTKKKKEYKS
jgi:hypothetical protein